MYGFDLVLDSNLDPWLIEINLSPACAERQPWLTQMLDDMAFDLLNWIEGKVITTQESGNLSKLLKSKRESLLKLKKQAMRETTLNPRSFYEQNKLFNRWQRLEACLDELACYEDPEPILFSTESRANFLP